MTLEKVKAARRTEAENAASALGVHDIQFFDLGDYPLEVDREAKYRLVDVIRKRPARLHAEPLASGTRTIPTTCTRRRWRSRRA